MLLSCGHGWLSDAIRFIDGGQYSHAGFYDGEKIIEATKAGIAAREISDDLKEQKYIHVYRYKGDKDEHLGNADFPVLRSKATTYLESGAKFAYQQLFLLAVLAVFRRTPLPLFLKKVLRAALDDAVSMFNDVLQNGKQPVTCSELVYRIFYEADDHKYGLSITDVIDINNFQRLAAAPARLDKETVKEDPDAAIFDLRAQEFAQMYMRGKSAGRQKAANPLVKADFVTPRDLEESTNLEKIGALSG